MKVADLEKSIVELRKIDTIDSLKNIVSRSLLLQYILLLRYDKTKSDEDLLKYINNVRFPFLYNIKNGRRSQRLFLVLSLISRRLATRVVRKFYGQK